MRKPFVVAAAVMLSAAALSTTPAYAADTPPAVSTQVSVTADRVKVVVDGVEIVIDTPAEGKPILRTPDAVTTDKPSEPSEPSKPAEPAEPAEPSKPDEAAADSSMVDQILKLVNEERAAEAKRTGKDLPPLQLDQCLTDGAQRVTETMVANNKLEHSDLSEIEKCGMRGGENIAQGYPTAAEVVKGWMESTEGHREAILSDKYTTIGIGHVANNGDPYYTQLFGEEPERKE